VPGRPAVRVEGLDELRRELRRVKDRELDGEMKQIHLDLAREVVDRAEPNVPVRTGRLKASLRAAGTVRDAIGRVGKASVPYAAVVHWKYGPPFLRDAAQSLEQDIVDRYDRTVAEMLDRTIGR
jgi:hypothetical protein